MYGDEQMPVSVDLPEEMQKDLEKKKEEGYYSSMSEIIRDALRDFLSEGEKTAKEEVIQELISEGKVEKVELEGEAKKSLQNALEE